MQNTMEIWKSYEFKGLAKFGEDISAIKVFVFRIWLRFVLY